jgi:acyl dehydratase
VALRRSFTAADLLEYAALTDDPGIAVKKPPPGSGALSARVPEPLIGALFSCLLGMELPGLGTNYLKQETHWHADARIGETLTARVEITRIRPEKHLVDLATTCTGEDGRTIASGRALVHVADSAGARRNA